MPRHNFRKLKIWNDSISFVAESYELTRGFPSSEKFNLISQMNRCAVSIPSNIAEGSSKSSDKNFKYYLEHSIGSAFEWESQLEVSYLIGYVKQEEYETLKDKIQQLQKMIGAFIDRLS